MALDKVPRDIIGRYTSDPFSDSLLRGTFSTFVSFVKALMNKDFGEQFEVAKSLFWLVNLLLMVFNISFM